MKYNLDKLEKDRDTFIYGDHGNIRDSAYIYSRKYNLKIKVKKLADGSMVTLLEGEHPIIVSVIELKKLRIISLLKAIWLFL